MTANAGIPRSRASLHLCLAVLLPTAAACHAGSSGPASTQRGEGQVGEKTTAASADAARTGARWTAGNKLARLEGSFSLDGDGRTLHIAYTVTNIGPYPLLVFDRGDALSVVIKRQSPGDVGVPITQFEAGDLTLRHVARPLSEPAPTAPPSPLVSQVPPGGEYQNRFSHALPDAASEQVRRVRYCQATIGVPEPLPESERRPGGVWSVPNAFAAHQGVLCSPWFEVATGRLVPED